ncbi:hypothetical protein DFJ58DRAFT_662698 [Suillus subalutaceus]|uniref:uncharacterized protein n=1 Tax=Suillus subalutaceus TaxID=48586 RepID=UPI001B85E5A4|nr:uncharacterized protein DFJ58DRAFT_662698 [Suillus subalutaceus]KAG1848922.1 hypothetical protein DFJ58DRAFT_662698 [Suillus subalutaceus]
MTECECPVPPVTAGCPVSHVLIIVYRVNWLWTKALRDRWNEEVIIVKHEMQWSINFFKR